jgi:hypothetical protein
MSKLKQEEKEILEPTFRTPLVEVAYFTACLAN